MMQLRSALLVGCALMICASCQPRGSVGEGTANPDEMVYEEIVAFPRDVTWSALTDLIAARQWRANTTNETRGAIELGSVAVPSDTGYFRCGSGRRDSYDDAKAHMSITVKQASASGTRVRIATLLDANDSSGRYSGRVVCKSAGRMEREIFAAIDSIVVSRRMN